MRTLEVRIQVEYSSLYLNVRGRIYYRNQHLSIYVLLVDAWFIRSLYLLQVLYHKSTVSIEYFASIAENMDTQS